MVTASMHADVHSRAPFLWLPQQAIAGSRNARVVSQLQTTPQHCTHAETFCHPQLHDLRILN
jgi:hypothetical protein